MSSDRTDGILNQLDDGGEDVQQREEDEELREGDEAEVEPYEPHRPVAKRRERVHIRRRVVGERKGGRVYVPAELHIDRSTGDYLLPVRKDSTGEWRATCGGVAVWSARGRLEGERRGKGRAHIFLG